MLMMQRNTAGAAFFKLANSPGNNQSEQNRPSQKVLELKEMQNA